MNGFTHLDANGKANMVDVTEKKETERMARAEGRITVNRAVYTAIKEGSAGKGDVLGTARIAGIMAAKKTQELIPLCHMLLLTKVSVDFRFEDEEMAVAAVCEVRLTGKTGAEMEALTGASAALLTIYDMCKAMDKGMVISNIHLLEKDGGKSGHYVFGDEQIGYME